MDTIAKYLTHDKSAQFIFVDATETVKEIIKKTDCLPPAGIFLGQAMLSCFLIHELTSKVEMRKTKLQWSVNGPLGNLYVDVNEKREGRGVITNPQAFSGKINESLGQGVLQVIRDQGKVHTGIVATKGDVCSDVLEYLHQSEQRSCAMNLWVHFDPKSKDLEIDKAVGYFFEVFPQKDSMRSELISTFWAEKLEELGSLSSWNFKEETNIKSMASVALEQAGQTTSENLLKFGCNCSEERAERALVFANKQDASTDQRSAEIVCEYCGQRYEVNLNKG